MSILHNSTIKVGTTEAAFAKPLGEWKTGNLSFEDFEAYQSVMERHPETKGMDSDGRRKFFIERRAELLKEISAIHANRKEKERALEFVEGKKVVIDKLFDFDKSRLKIQRPDGVSFRKMRKDFAEDRTVYLGKDFYEATPKIDFEKEIFRYAEVLLIEHDWASVVKIADGQVKLPYDVCAFEFNFSGNPVIALATQFNDDIQFCPIVLIDGFWCVPDFAFDLNITGLTGTDHDIGLMSLFEAVRNQIRAACISLDAEVAKAEVVRSPHTGAQGKNSHQLLKPYHVVSLARRGPMPLASIGTETGRRVRLHFRRGHWRHFVTHKTWLKWQLVGDPDLGFIDKHYKL
jgi:hypothetical protein